MLKIKKSKKGISLMIAYLLLVSMGIVLSIFVYNYLKTYVQMVFQFLFKILRVMVHF